MKFDHHTADLFEEGANPSVSAAYADALAAWLGDAVVQAQVRRDSSIGVYEHMWQALTEWAVAERLSLRELNADALEAYLDSRGGTEDLSARYAWRLLHLVGRVLRHHSDHAGLERTEAVTEVHLRRPEIRFANSAAADELPEYLSAAEGKRLVLFLSAVRPGRALTGRPWQEVRNRASVGLMLGAGLTPGEVRSLKVDSCVVNGGRVSEVPWKLKVAGDGNGPERETPLAEWAGRLLAYWLQIRAEQKIPGQVLFPSTRSSGKPWSKMSQYVASRSVLTHAGVDAAAGGSFRLRHTFALRQLRRGHSEADVARWLGVSDPSVISRYRRVLSAPITDLI